MTKPLNEKDNSNHFTHQWLNTNIWPHFADTPQFVGINDR